MQVKKIYSRTTTYANQNPIIPFCLFYLKLQNKVSHDYILLKMVMLLFQRQILLPLPYKQVASYFIPYILLASYFLSRTRKLLFLKILYYNVTFYLTLTKYKSYFFKNKSYFLYHINKSQVTSYHVSCILLVCYFMSQPRKLFFFEIYILQYCFFLTFTKYKSYFS